MPRPALETVRAQTWQWYRDFFSLSYLRYMALWFALVPLVAAVLSDVPSRLVVPFTDPPLVLNIVLPVSWQVLWISSLLFVIAFTIYAVKAPTFVKRYHSFDDYLKMGHSPRWIPWESKALFMAGFEREKFVTRLREKGYAIETPGIVPGSPSVEVSRLSTDFSFEFSGKGYLLSMPIVSNDAEDSAATAIAVREIFWEVFGRYAASHPRWRMAVSILLWMSGAGVLFVFVQNIWAGLRYFI